MAQIFLDNEFDKYKGFGKNATEAEQRKAMETRAVMLSVLDSFLWPHGPKLVHARSLNGGIQPQWMEAWWPNSVNEFAFVAEDDTEVSPFFYIYFKRIVMFYYYNQSNFDPSVFGVSFQRLNQSLG